MWNKWLARLRGRARTSECTRRQQRFFDRFDRRTLIVHAGLTVQWMEELLKVGGGGGHFRVDTRIPLTEKPTPVEWVVHEFILPLQLPLPVLLRVHTDTIIVRHLTDRGYVRHPADIAWLLDDMKSVDEGGRGRVHARLVRHARGFIVERGIPPEDNGIEVGDGVIL